MPAYAQPDVLVTVAKYMARAQIRSETSDEKILRFSALRDVAEIPLQDIHHELRADPELLQEVLTLRKYAKLIIMDRRYGSLIAATAVIAIIAAGVLATYGTAAFFVPMLVAAPFGALGVGMTIGGMYLSKYRLSPLVHSMAAKYQNSPNNSPNSELGKELFENINRALANLSRIRAYKKLQKLPRTKNGRFVVHTIMDFRTTPDAIIIPPPTDIPYAQQTSAQTTDAPHAATHAAAELTGATHAGATHASAQPTGATYASAQPTGATHASAQPTGSQPTTSASKKDPESKISGPKKPRS